MVLNDEDMTDILKIIMVSFLLFLPGFASGQESWSLTKCINYALEHNLSQQVYELSEQAATIDANQSKFNLLPSLSASSSAGLSFGRSVDPNTNDIVNNEFFNNSNRLGASLAVFQGFIQQNRIAYSKFRLEAAKWEKVNHQDDLAFSILMTYYDVIYYQGMVSIAREQLCLSENNLKKAEVLIETGLKAKTDLAEMQATYEKEKLNLLQAENRLEEMKLKLAQGMNLPGESFKQVRFECGEPAVGANPAVVADSLYASFVKHSPVIKSAEAVLQASAKEVAISRGQFFPSIHLNASINTGYYETNRDADGRTISFRDQLNNNRSQYVGASISIPIFARNQVRSQFRKARLAEDQARTQLENYRQTVYYELLNNCREMQALFREYIQTGKQVDADELAYQVAHRKYEEGLIDVIELQAVKNRLAGSESQRLQARLQWEIKLKVVDFYKGIRFWEQ